MKLKFKAFAAFMLAAVVSLALFLSPSEAAKARQLRYYAARRRAGGLLALRAARRAERSLRRGAALEREKDRQLPQIVRSAQNRPVVASHPHEDHIGGMKELLSKIPIKQIWDSGYNHGSKVQRDFYQMIKDKKIPFGRPKRGYAAKLGDVTLEVLAPARPLKGTSSDANNNGLIVLVTYGGVSFLMMGDAQKEEQETVSPLPRAAVLKAAHHGAANGTDAALLRDVSPDIVILSYKRGNSYGHPHRETVAAIRKAKILRFDTADGPVKLRTDGKSVTFERKRVVK